MTRKATTVMRALIGLVKPLLHVMIAAIFLGVMGYLCAIFITVLAAIGVALLLGYIETISLITILMVMIIIAILRGFLRYGEQASNHYIAFKLLALIRNKIFSKLRTLAPAKLEGKDKGNLISIITSDIELLEVFYAHTISPIAIAIVVSLIMIVFIGSYHWILASIAIFAYFTLGYVVPVYFSKKGAVIGQSFRDDYGKMNSFVLDSLRGIKESIQFKHGQQRLQEMNNKTDGLEDQQYLLKRLEAQNKAVSDSLVLVFSLAMLITGIHLQQQGTISIAAVMITTITMLSSFGPVLALSGLANNLYHTIASGNRVLDLLADTPIVSDITNQKEIVFGDIEISNMSFSYGQEEIIKDMNLKIKKNEIVGIHGKSGSGKSTLLKLLMRFWQVQEGNITINNTDIENINTTNLRDIEAYVTQETYLFNDSIANNITFGKENITIEQMQEAAKKASIHDFIMELPNGYETLVGELGGSLSGGEKQRIGVARAFLHNANLLLLDEPTSNLDSLNEAIIIKSLKEESTDKTIILVSHRDSTMHIADTVYTMADFRIS